MTLLLQVSDPHFGTERPPVVRALQRFAHAQRPDVLLLTGDITQRATRAQFAAAREFVERLGVPQVLIVPGNHDIPLINLLARALAPYANLRSVFGAELEPAFECERLLVITVNTTRNWRHKGGDVSPAQIERVAQRLHRAGPLQLRVVAAHHPVAVTLRSDRRNRLHGQERAVRRWSEAGADLIVGGHIHLPYTLPLHEQRPGLPRPVWAVQAGTAVSARIRRETDNSVNLIRCLEPDAAAPRVRRCRIERWDYDRRSDAFRPAGDTELRFNGPTRESGAGPADGGR